MFRYIAFSWNSNDSKASATARSLQNRLQQKLSPWRVAFSQSGLTVYYSSENPDTRELYPLSDNGGVILGTLFERNGELSGEDVAPARMLSLEQSEAILHSGGRRLMESHWGSYVAFLYEKSRSLFVVRGPISDLPCLYTESGGIHIWFSQMDDCVELGSVDFSVDWNYLAIAVLHRPPVTPKTGLKEVTEIVMGECMEIRDDQVVKRFYWDPCVIVRTGGIDLMDEAVRRLRSTTMYCVHSWASCFEGILLRLSGGLDSSIVLACLASAPTRPRVTCVNNYSGGSGGDERKYALAAARSAHCELIERERDYHVSLERFKLARRSPRPVRDFGAYANHRPDVELARTKGATAILWGAYGDALFGQSAYQHAAADYLWRRGIDSGFVRAVRDSAHRANLSVWEVLSHAIRTGLFGGAASRRTLWLAGAGQEVRLKQERHPDLRLATPDAFDIAERTEAQYVHPWFASREGISPGKRAMLVSILAGEPTYTTPFAVPSDPPLLSPLYSQPLVELALRIGSHLCVYDGIDRAVVRRAFEPELPKEIFNRTSKGTPMLWMQEIIRRNMGFVREYLLSGLLVNERILDSSKLASVLGDAPTKLPHSEVQLMRLLYHEAWLRSWTSVNSPRNAATVRSLSAA